MICEQKWGNQLLSRSQEIITVFRCTVQFHKDEEKHAYNVYYVQMQRFADTWESVYILLTWNFMT